MTEQSGNTGRTEHDRHIEGAEDRERAGSAGSAPASAEAAGDGPYEVIVVGGGPAGLSAALVLGRSRRRTLVVDAGEPRNAPSAHLHGYLSRDGMAPADLLAAGREEIARYGVDLVRDRVVEVTRGGGGFAVRLAGDARAGAGRTVHARRLVLATGLADELPPVPGVAERFGRDVLHCPYCHGWEVRDRAFGVLATTPMSVHQTLIVSQWSKDVTLFLHTVGEEELTDEDRRRLDTAGVDVVRGEVAALVVEEDRLTGVRLAGDGGEHAREVLFVAPRPVPRTQLAVRLGARTDRTPFGEYPLTDERGLTSVPGLWAVGNAAGYAEQIVNAASRGYRAGAAINMELLMTDLDAAGRR
ncbi:NAD(P)/FAD-dependent oxidoreductase [Streptomyces sp. NBC_00704]|uniref:NAD(P)/FAD-dependent oxidoreductase n=1 Tax=Streptomyces sp. NBC_00704 TaxID=2975809 RepID=UPI002E379C21|nr:NAD(P)/FAD-dependent oxidoreductase [Streptomyces sp. NBC_00704]